MNAKVPMIAFAYYTLICKSEDILFRSLYIGSLLLLLWKSLCTRNCGMRGGEWNLCSKFVAVSASAHDASTAMSSLSISVSKHGVHISIKYNA